ncbi:sulfate adenylyltransferase subunit CysN [Hwanghaeella sp.]|uniref:sulfate adenylyltransferase subunit CysN n=1 Tax=Hwanghaeella sp. TaxID=2605943 RepID=UPI003CCBE2B6
MDALQTTDIDAYLREQSEKPMLRFITCGSVDDGKSTLIGRLLYDSKLIFEDQLASLESDSRKVGTVENGIDFALLVDGLQAEREQGITIDVAYRFFATDARKFIVADAPGHEQYTRNMATGASNVDVAVILADARKGVLTQTKRHSFIAHLVGIKDVILAVNKMDLVDYSQDRFEEIAAEYRAFASEVGIQNVIAVPLSALKGDNVLESGEAMPWYDGPTLLGALEGITVTGAPQDAPFRLPVQWVNRPNLNFRGFSGTIAGGQIAVGNEIAVMPSGRTSTVTGILDQDGDAETAEAGEAVTITLADEIDISRGDVICAADNPAQITDQFAAHLIWMTDEKMYPGRQYLMKIGSATVSATVTEIKHAINVNSLEHNSAKQLDLNTVAFCNFSLDRAIAYDPYAENQRTGAFILIDRFNNQTVGAGMISFGLRRATNLVWQELDIDKAERARMKGQTPGILWFTGLSGAGKSTVANLVEKRLHSLGKHTYILDGDNVRHGLNRDLGFTDADRVENIRRVGETAKLFVDAGMIVVVSFISPFRSERTMVRQMVEDSEFLEVFVDAPLEVCETRDPKGLYAKAREGSIKNFTGIDSPYEPPENPELHLMTGDLSPEQAAEKVIEAMRDKGMI